MGKRLFLLVFAGIMGLVSTSTALTAADRFSVNEPEFRATETVPLLEPVEGSAVARELVEEPVATTDGAVTAYVAESTSTVEPVAPQIANYTVTIYSAEMVAHYLSYSDIYKTGKLIYGHNTGQVLGDLAYRYVGEEFTITEGGVATKYRVSDIALYEKTDDGYLDHNRALMGQIMRTAMGHGVALMTCAGTPYGNGDASHRLVVYADAV